MNILRHRRITRRSLLRAAGVSLPLPWLEAMQPLHADQSGPPPVRTLFFYTPNGMYMPSWTPEAEGRLEKLPEILRPLEPHLADFSVLSNLANMEAYRDRGVSRAAHAPNSGCFLTCSSPRVTIGSDVRSGISVDQVIARELGTRTRLPSLELSVETPTGTGICDSGYHCTYTTTISWRSPTTPASRDISPRSVFERLFADPGAAREDEVRQRRSILDFVLADARELTQRVGAADRLKVEQYLDSVREIERRVQAYERNPPVADRSLASNGPLPIVPADFAEHTRLMIDLLVAALATDSIPVGSLMLGNEISQRSYPEINVRNGHHEVSHHASGKERVEKYTAIGAYHMSFFAYLLDRLKNTHEGEHTLLDRSQVMFGCCIGDGNDHKPEDLPVLLAGRGNGSLRHGFHRRYAATTPIANLYLAMLEQAGIQMPRFGDSTGPLGQLT
jgi:hypothetical protein